MRCDFVHNAADHKKTPTSSFKKLKILRHNWLGQLTNFVADGKLRVYIGNVEFYLWRMSCPNASSLTV